ncbi:hypothetical protein P154DRAFT_128625 [Amniculicola lignicola CBS 123094]|uniref:Uncharacterized protein n=1 Tax=Amniculicola lignicola CBS 123094 TaxID=1392246 RepID=A0A6A5VTR3_9PLEO|nr:hypothetical protein P154DRAFT_128625 [Amniculicola lignicola CBS 123094]
MAPPPLLLLQRWPRRHCVVIHSSPTRSVATLSLLFPNVPRLTTRQPKPTPHRPIDRLHARNDTIDLHARNQTGDKESADATLYLYRQNGSLLYLSERCGKPDTNASIHTCV